MNKESVIITSNNYSKRKSFVVSFNVGQQVFSFRMPTEFNSLYEMFKELARREGISKSQLVVKAICEYVHRHYPGNPQVPLTKFTTVDTIRQPSINPEKKKTRQTLINVIHHLKKGYDLSPKSRQFYIRLAKENRNLEESVQLLELLPRNDEK